MPWVHIPLPPSSGDSPSHHPAGADDRGLLPLTSGPYPGTFASQAWPRSPAGQSARPSMTLDTPHRGTHSLWPRPLLGQSRSLMHIGICPHSLWALLSESLQVPHCLLGFRPYHDLLLSTPLVHCGSMATPWIHTSCALALALRSHSISFCGLMPYPYSWLSPLKATGLALSRPPSLMHR